MSEADDRDKRLREAETIVPKASGQAGPVSSSSLPAEVTEARKNPERLFGKYVLLRLLG